MAEKRKDLANIEDKITANSEYMQRNGVTQQIKEAMLKLIENRPQHPMLFLAEFFDSINSSEKADKLQSAVKTLKLTHHSQQAFQTNLMIAYDAISAPKATTSKKPQRLGLTGGDYEQLLITLGTNIPKNILSNLITKVGCRSNEMVPFDVFRYGVTVCLVCSEYVELGADLFHILCSKADNSMADKQICDATLSVFQNAIDGSVSYESKSGLFSLNAGYNLRPDKLAVAMMNASESSKNKLLMNQTDFIYAVSEIFLCKVKQIK
ncbi:tubulin polyglutamylase complex subunit 1-like [Ciona intestinalis]